MTCRFSVTHAGTAEGAQPAAHQQTPGQRAPATQQRDRTPGAIAALTPVLGSKPAQQADALPDSPEALPVTARTPGSTTPATQPAAVVPAADAASPDAAPATQSGAEEEEPARAAEGPKRLLLVFDDRPYTLRAEHIIGLTVPDELAGDNHSLSNRALCADEPLTCTGARNDAVGCVAEQFSSARTAAGLSITAVPCTAQERLQVGVLTAHVCLAVRPASHATTDPEAARGLDLAALSRWERLFACTRNSCLPASSCLARTDSASLLRKQGLQHGGGIDCSQLQCRLVELVVEARRSLPPSRGASADTGGLAGNVALSSGTHGQTQCPLRPGHILCALCRVVMRWSNVIHLLAVHCLLKKPPPHAQRR